MIALVAASNCTARRQAPAALGAHAIRTRFPASVVEQPGRLVGVERPARVGAAQALWLVDEIDGGHTLPAVDEVLHVLAVHQQPQRLADHRVAEQRMARISVPAFTVQLGMEVADIQVDRRDRAGGQKHHTLKALVLGFQAFQQFVFDQHASCVVVVTV